MKNYILPFPKKPVYALGGQLEGRFLGLFDEGGSLYDNGGEHTAEEQFIMNGKEDAYRTHFNATGLYSPDPRMLPYGVSNVGTNTTSYGNTKVSDDDIDYKNAFNSNASFSNAAGADKFMVERPWLNNLFNKGNVRTADINNRFDIKKINKEYGSLENLLATGEYQLGQNGEIVNTPNVSSLFDSSITNGNEETYNGGYGQFVLPNAANNNQGSFNTSISNNNNETTSTSAKDYWEQFGQYYNSDSDPYLYSNPDSIRMLNETGFYGSPAENQNKRYGGDLLKAQEGWESFYPEHLNEIDISNINQQNNEKINSQAYRDRVKIEYLNAHNITLSETELDEMIAKLNIQLEQGADKGNTGFYTDFAPDENALGFMINGPSQISADGFVLNPNESGYDPTSKSAGTIGNIYVGTNSTGFPAYATQINPKTGEREKIVSAENSILQHEVNHRINFLDGTPLSSAKNNPLNKASKVYHNQFLQIGDKNNNPYHPDYADREFHNYATEAYEIKSQKAQLEQALLEAGIWDSSKGPFTQEHVDEMVRRKIKFSDGTNYLPIALGLDQLIEGTIDNPGALKNPITDYNNFVEGPFNRFLGSQGKKNMGRGNTKEKGSDWRSLNASRLQDMKNRIETFPQGGKKFQEWLKNHRILNADKLEAGSIVYGLDNFLEEGTSGSKTTDNLLESLGLKKDSDGYYITTPEDNKRIQDLRDEWELKETEIIDKYDESYQNQPKEGGLFGSHGPIKNRKYNKLKRNSVKRFNDAYKTDFKTWDEIVSSQWFDEYSTEDLAIRDHLNENPSDWSSLDHDFTQEMRDLSDLYQTIPWHHNDNNQEYYLKNGRLKGNDIFNIALANDYMENADEYQTINNSDKKTIYNRTVDNTYRPTYDAGSNSYMYPIDKINFENNNKAALENNIWYKDLYTQAVLNLPVEGRNAFLEYYNQDPNKKYTTKQEVREQKERIKIMQVHMDKVRMFVNDKYRNHLEFIEKGNQQYELDKEKQFIDDNQKNQKLYDKIGPNFMDFMNNVVMGDDESGSDNIEVMNARYGGQLQYILNKQYGI